MNCKKILFITRCCIFDDSSGAAIATRTLMRSLTSSGVDVHVLCGISLDHRLHSFSERLFPKYDLRLSNERPSCLTSERHRFKYYAPTVEADGFCTTIDFGQTILDDPKSGGMISIPALYSFEHIFEILHEIFRPDVVMGYGGDNQTFNSFKYSKSQNTKSVLVLHNLNYTHHNFYDNIDDIIVPTEFAASYYAEKLGRPCTVLSNVLDPSRFLVHEKSPAYLTFVNPSPEKGLYPFVRIAYELGCSRPDIPILVVESRGTEQMVATRGLDLRSNSNIFFMAQTSNPQHFWRHTKILLMPSVCLESQGLTALEAILNGLPVVASDRGALPETLSTAGFTLPLPPDLSPSSSRIPSRAEISHWLDLIIKLWDDLQFYEETCSRSSEIASHWDYSAAGKNYVDFLSRVIA